GREFLAVNQKLHAMTNKSYTRCPYLPNFRCFMTAPFEIQNSKVPPKADSPRRTKVKTLAVVLSSDESGRRICLQLAGGSRS
ncbi:MAG: hypothetical protein M1303_00205, partial [Bacteroidetes bacterium]|nr:hypothetical protein [Bacteroidota bacterium]